MDHDGQGSIKSILRTLGLPDGNGQGWHLWKVARTAVVTAVAGFLSVAAVRWSTGQVIIAAEATAAIYRDVPQHGRDIRELQAETAVLKARPPMPQADVDKLAEAIAKAMKEQRK